MGDWRACGARSGLTVGRDGFDPRPVRALVSGSEEEAAGLLDAYLERANTAARLAAIE